MDSCKFAFEFRERMTEKRDAKRKALIERLLMIACGLIGMGGTIVLALTR